VNLIKAHCMHEIITMESPCTIYVW
jgi:hypothetical protein